jgi:hypothetical protein
MEILRAWLVTFGMIVIKPLPQTFVSESKKAKGKFSSAVAWVVFDVIATLIFTYFIAHRTYSFDTILLTILVLPIAILIFAFCIYKMYLQLFGGKQDCHQKILYLIVGILVPFLLINQLVSFIPKIGIILSLITLIYPFILIIVAVMAITKLKIWQSIVAVLIGSLTAFFGLIFAAQFILDLTDVFPRIFFRL